jgi:16S rRNA (cytosine1402-N4)-methyltransferase
MTTHISVLYQESLDALLLAPGKIIVDGTFGAGGHSKGIAEQIGKKGTLIAFDQDGEVFTKPIVHEIRSFTNFVPIIANFRTMAHELSLQKIDHIDGVLLDLGLSSTQLEVSGRGFSFQRDEPLAMTFSDKPEEQLVTAETVVNKWSRETITEILRGFGEEQFAWRIAGAIVEAREKSAIKTTNELVAIIKSAVPGWYQHGRTHFATRTFQALRMAVNDETGSAEEGMRSAFALLAPGGRLAVISFHSIEDRLVKQTMKDLAENAGGLLITKKPKIAGEEELAQNPRSRSAKLRIIEKS